jgi:mannose-1-phosphate guanylyltransferase
MISPVILSGGSGTRLWPLSRADYPKQFLPLFGDQSLFQATLQRVAGLSSVASPLVVCSEEHRFLNC